MSPSNLCTIEINSCKYAHMIDARVLKICGCCIDKVKALKTQLRRPWRQWQCIVAPHSGLINASALALCIEALAQVFALVAATAAATVCAGVIACGAPAVYVLCLAGSPYMPATHNATHNTQKPLCQRDLYQLTPSYRVTTRRILIADKT
jgi:hypothetical protein